VAEAKLEAEVAELRAVILTLKAPTVIDHVPIKSSLRNEIAALLAEVEELKAKQQSRGWAYVTVDKGENRDAEISSLEARGYSVVVSHIIDPEPRILDPHEELPREVKLVVDESKRQQRSNVIEARRLKAEERPYPIEYPEQVY
jgi:hypothetical protein